MKVRYKNVILKLVVATTTIFLASCQTGGTLIKPSGFGLGELISSVSKDLKQKQKVDTPVRVEKNQKYYNMANEMYKKRDISGSLKTFIKSCNSREGIGCRAMGFISFKPTTIYNGVYSKSPVNISRNAAKGLSYFKRGCDLNDAVSCANAGVMIVNKEGAAFNPDLALQYVEKACKLGNKNGCSRATEMKRNKQASEESTNRYKGMTAKYKSLPKKDRMYHCMMDNKWRSNVLDICNNKHLN